MKTFRNIFSNKDLVLSSYRQWCRVMLKQAVKTLELSPPTRFIRQPLKKKPIVSNSKTKIISWVIKYRFCFMIVVSHFNY